MGMARHCKNCGQNFLGSAHVCLGCPTCGKQVSASPAPWIAEQIARRLGEIRLGLKESLDRGHNMAYGSYTEIEIAEFTDGISYIDAILSSLSTES